MGVTPRNPKEGLNVFSFDACQDTSTVKFRSSYKIPQGKIDQKQFCLKNITIGKRDHYGIAPHYPVFFVKTEVNGGRKKWGRRRQALQTINGLVVDKNNIRNEKQLIENTVFMGVAHTERVDRCGVDEYFITKSSSFHVDYYGPMTLMNYTFTETFRDKNGLILKSSCRPTGVQTGDLLTLTFFPFDFEVVEKIKKAKVHNTWEREFGSTIEELRDTMNLIVKSEAYDPTELGYYQHWYQNNMQPREVSDNERMIAVWRKVNPQDARETEEIIRSVLSLMIIRFVVASIYPKKIKDYKELYDMLHVGGMIDENSTTKILDSVLWKDIVSFIKSYGQEEEEEEGEAEGEAEGREAEVSIEEKPEGKKSEGKKILPQTIDDISKLIKKYLNLSRVPQAHFKVLGDPADNSSVPFGSEMYGVLLMDRTL